MTVYFNKTHTKLLHYLAEVFGCDIFSKEYEETVEQIYMILTSYFQRRYMSNFAVIPITVPEDVAYLLLLKYFIDRCDYPITVTDEDYEEDEDIMIDYLTITWDCDEVKEEVEE